MFVAGATMSDTIEGAIGNLALDLIDKVRRTMEETGDAPEDFTVSGAYVMVLVNGDDSHWRFSSCLPENPAMRIGFGTMIRDTELAPPERVPEDDE